MSKISGKLKNSYAIDLRGKLYSWGSGEFGMLGFPSEKDVITPTKVPLEEKLSDEYFCEMVSSGQFHTGVIVNKIYEEDQKADFEFCADLIFAFREWLRFKMPKLIWSAKHLLFLLLRINESKINGMNDASLNFFFFEKFFLNGFYNYQKMHKKEYFKINKTYNFFLKQELNVNSKKEFLISNLNKIFESQIKEFVELRNYIEEIYRYLKAFPDDSAFFIKFICRFENFVTEDDVKNVFSLVKIQERNFSSKNLKSFKQKEMNNQKSRRLQGKIIGEIAELDSSQENSWELSHEKNEEIEDENKNGKLKEIRFDNDLSDDNNFRENNKKSDSYSSEKNQSSDNNYSKSNNASAEDENNISNLSDQINFKLENNESKNKNKNRKSKQAENYEINYYDEKNETNFLLYDKQTNSLCEQIFEKFLENTSNQQESGAFLLQQLTNENSDLKKNEQIINISRLVNLIVDGVDSQGMLFMWGVASEGRLGIQKEQIELNFVSEKEQKENLKSENLKKQEKLVYEDSLNKKILNNYRISYMRKKEKNLNFFYDEDLDDEVTKNKNANVNIDEEFKVVCNPVLIKFPEFHTKIVKVSCGFCHSLALSEQGRLYSWGLNKFSCLGRGSEEKVCETPKMIMMDFDGNDLYLISNFNLNYANSNNANIGNNKLKNNQNNLIADGSKNSSDKKNTIFYNNENLVNNNINDNINNNKNQIIDIGTGIYYSAFLTKGGDLYTWGFGANGRLGHNSINSIAYPKKLEFFNSKLPQAQIESFSVGDSHMAAITRQKLLFCWGAGANGKLGNGVLDDKKAPFPVKSLRTHKVSYAACGSSNTIAVTTENKFFVFGKNQSGMLGIFKEIDKSISIPAELDLNLNDVSIKILEVCLANSHMLLRLSNGEVLSLGSNAKGVLGHSNPGDKVPVAKAIHGFKAFKENKVYLPYVRQNNLFREYAQDFKLFKIGVNSQFFCSNGNFKKSNFGKSRNSESDNYNNKNNNNVDYKIDNNNNYKNENENNLINNNTNKNNNSVGIRFNKSANLCALSENEICFIACSEKNTLFISFEGELFICGDSRLIPEELVIPDFKLQNLFYLQRNTLNNLLINNVNFGTNNINTGKSPEIGAKRNSSITSEISGLNLLKNNINKKTIRGSLLNNGSQNFSDLNLLRIDFQNKLQKIQEQSEDEQSIKNSKYTNKNDNYANNSKKDYESESFISKNKENNIFTDNITLGNKSESEASSFVDFHKTKSINLINNNANKNEKELVNFKSSGLINVISKLNKSSSLNLALGAPLQQHSNNKASSRKVTSVNSSANNLNSKLNSKINCNQALNNNDNNKNTNHNNNNPQNNTNNIIIKNTNNHKANTTKNITNTNTITIANPNLNKNNKSENNNNNNNNPLSLFSIKKLNFKEKITYAALGKNHALIITAEKNLFSWGCSEYGKLGLNPSLTAEGGYTFHSKPIQIKSIPLPKMACCSDTHSLVLTQTGIVYAFGSNMYGKLGIRNFESTFDDQNFNCIPFIYEPRIIEELNDVVFISCSESHNLAIVREVRNSKMFQEVYSWGCGYAAKLGHRNVLDCKQPKKVYFNCGMNGYSSSYNENGFNYNTNTNKNDNNNFRNSGFNSNFFNTNNSNDNNFNYSSVYNFNNANQSCSVNFDNNNFNKVNAASPLKEFTNSANKNNTADLTKSPIKTNLEEKSNPKIIIKEKFEELNNNNNNNNNNNINSSIFSVQNNLNINPIQIENLISENANNNNSELKKINFIKVCAGDEFSLFLDSIGNLWGVGRKKYLGLFEDESYINNDILLEPTILNPENCNKIKFVNSAKNFSVVIDEEGFLYGFGKLPEESNFSKENKKQKKNKNENDENKSKIKNQNFFKLQIKSKNDENFIGSKFAVKFGLCNKQLQNTTVVDKKLFNDYFSFVALGDYSFFGIAYNKDNCDCNFYCWGSNSNEELGFKLIAAEEEAVRNKKDNKENLNPKHRNNCNNNEEININNNKIIETHKDNKNINTPTDAKKYKNSKLEEYANLDYFKYLYFNTNKIFGNSRNKKINKINNDNIDNEENYNNYNNNYENELNISSESKESQMISLTEGNGISSNISLTRNNLNNPAFQIDINNNYAVIKKNSILLNNYNLNINLANKNYLMNNNLNNIDNSLLHNTNNLEADLRRKSYSTKNVFYFRKNGSIMNKLNILGESGLEQNSENLIFEEQIKNDKNIKNKLQMILLEEKFENKNEGLIKEDMRISVEFSDIFAEFIFHMSNVFLSKAQFVFETENLLLLKLKSKNEKLLVNKIFVKADDNLAKKNKNNNNNNNKNQLEEDKNKNNNLVVANNNNNLNYNKNLKSCFLKIENKAFFSKYSEIGSTLPKAIAKHMLLYENLLEIALIHPCYFIKIYSLNENNLNKKVFLELLKSVFNVNTISLEGNRFTQNSLISLFFAFLKYERLNIENFILEKKITNRNSLLNDNEYKNIGINEMYFLLKNQKREIYDSPVKKNSLLGEANINNSNNNNNNIISTNEKLIAYISNYKFFCKKIFNFIFYNCKANLEIIYNIITEIIIDITSNFLSEEAVEILVTTVSWKGNFLEFYSKISESFKTRLTESIIGVIENSICEMFDEKKISSKKFSDSIFLILVNVIKLKNNKISKALFFSFVIKPILKVFENVFLGGNTHVKYQIRNAKGILIHKILKFFKDKDNNYINNGTFSKYNKLKNLMQMNEQDVKTEIFDKVLNADSKILKDIYAVLKFLENSNEFSFVAEKANNKAIIYNNNNNKVINLIEISDKGYFNNNNRNLNANANINNYKQRIINEAEKLSSEQKLLINNFRKNLFDRLFRRIQSYKFNFNFVFFHLKDFLQKNAKEVNCAYSLQVRLFDLLFLKEFFEKYIDSISLAETDPLRLILAEINFMNKSEAENLIVLSSKQNSNKNYLKNNKENNNIINNSEDEEENLISQINFDLQKYKEFYEYLNKEKTKATEYLEYYKDRRYAKYKFPKGTFNVLENVLNIKVNPYSFSFKALTKNMRNINKALLFSSENMQGAFCDFANNEDNPKNKSDDSNKNKNNLIENLNNLKTNFNFNNKININNINNYNKSNKAATNIEEMILTNRETAKIKLLKCTYCKTPLASNFFAKNIIEAHSEKSDWECFYCGKPNNHELIQCSNNLCCKIKRVKQKQNSLFKKLKIPFSSKETFIFENALFNLPTLNAEENVFKACLLELQKHKGENLFLEHEKKEALENFVNLIHKKIGLNAIDFVDNPVSDLNNFINELNFNSAKNFEAREKHRIYLSKIREIVSFMRQILNMSNNFLENFKEQNLAYSNLIISEKFILDEKIANIKNGNYTLSYLLNNNKNKRVSNLTAALRKKSLNLNINSLNKPLDVDVPQNQVSIKNKFNVSKLIKQKVIENVNYAENKLKEFVRKTYLSIEKTDFGFTFKIVYKEANKNLLYVCASNKNEYIIDEFTICYLEMAELRRLCGYNSYLTRSDIRFNLFYLINLLNGM